jgi:hypothetical protein
MATVEESSASAIERQIRSDNITLSADATTAFLDDEVVRA